MNIHFKRGSETISDKIMNRAEAKLSKLSRFIVERNYEAQAFISIDRESGSHNSDKMWRASINFDSAGDRYTAAYVSSSPGKALDCAIKELKDELRRANEKQQQAYKRGGNILKRLQRGFA